MADNSFARRFKSVASSSSSPPSLQAEVDRLKANEKNMQTELAVLRKLERENAVQISRDLLQELFDRAANTEDACAMALDSVQVIGDHVDKLNRNVEKVLKYTSYKYISNYLTTPLSLSKNQTKSSGDEAFRSRTMHPYRGQQRQSPRCIKFL